MSGFSGIAETAYFQEFFDIGVIFPKNKHAVFDNYHGSPLISGVIG
jgi:hypothetical protein